MKTKLSRAALYGILSISITFSMSMTAIGQKDTPPPLPVRVTNTEPIPVSGTVNVASAPDTPVTVTGNVNVSGQVTVSNAANSPLTVRELNSVAKKPIQLSGSCNSSEPGVGCSRVINYLVPDGKLFVIEYVSTRYSGPTGSRGKVVILTCMDTIGCISGGGPFPLIDRRAGHYLDPTGVTGSWSGDTNHAGISQKVLIFGNDKSPVTIFGQCSPGLTCAEEFFFMNVTVSGYLIDNP